MARRRLLLLFAVAVGFGAALACGSDYEEASAAPLADASFAHDAPADGGCSDGACGSDAGHTPLAVTGGLDFGCTLLADESVWCWGSDAVGQLGPSGGQDKCTFISTGHTVEAPCQHHAVRVDGLPPARAIAGGAQSACAVAAADGSVWCWGDNVQTTLGARPGTGSDRPCVNLTDDYDPTVDGGYSTTNCSPTPRHVEGITGVKMLAINYQNACALTENGDVYCWGSSGSLGTPDAGEVNPTPVRVAGLPADVRQISTGVYWEMMCAVTDSGKVYCWGRDTGLQPASATPIELTAGGMPFSDAVQVLIGNGYGCVLSRDGSVRCFGGNSVGELGQRTCSDTKEPPLVVTGIPGVKAIAGRWSHNCALDEDGKVYCWGIAILGALGGGTIEGSLRCDPVLTGEAPHVVDGLPPVVALSASCESTYAIDRDGKIWGWGTNDLARAGHAPKTDGDLLNCGDPNNQSVCNPKPMLVEGLP